MRTAAVPEMRESKRKRFVWEDYFPDLLELLRIDSLASHGDLEVYERIRTYMNSLPPEVARPKPLLTGRDLMDMGYSPGPLFKDILTAVEDAQLEGELSTPDAARAFVREHYPADSR
jgi:poly(A) polymerase